MENTKKQIILRAVKEQNIPLKEIASKLYMTERQLKILLESWGIELPRKRRYSKVPMPEREGLIKLYQRYGNTLKVAEYFNVGVNTVNRWMKELRIPMKKMHLGKEEKVKFLEEHISRLNDIRL